VVRKDSDCVPILQPVLKTTTCILRVLDVRLDFLILRLSDHHFQNNRVDIGDFSIIVTSNHLFHLFRLYL
jgi:hypothetical protein